jgi:translation initiation factor IF-2
MSETNDTTKRPGKTLTLKKTELSTVKQSFSHGRTKAVVVEKKRSTGPVTPAKAPAAGKAKPEEAKAVSTPVPARDSARPGVVLRQLTDEEKARRGAALADARVYEEEARKRAEEDARRRVDEDSKLSQEREAAAKRKTE